jgi:cytochrome c peroxidase
MKSLKSRFHLRAAMLASFAGLVGLFSTASFAQPAEAGTTYPPLAVLAQAKPANPDMAELGRLLFFDRRLAGDMTLSCATCHHPNRGWGDGEPLSRAYPSSEYFRNSPSLINARHRVRFMWDGRLDGADLATLVRDQVTEAPFLNADARLVQERLKQVPEYVALWEKIYGKGADPYGPRMFSVMGEFLKTLESKNVPFDKFAQGDANAISAQAKEGFKLFTGKAACIQCHNGPMASDGKFHRLGVPEHPDVLANPLRTITMLRHYSTSGMPSYMNARTDVGHYAISKDERDRGKFLTPSLRELKHTAPYMHNGVFETLDEAIEFYNKGGGPGSELKPLGLTDAEKKALLAFLETLSGDLVTVPIPPAPDEEDGLFPVRAFGKN